MRRIGAVLRWAVLVLGLSVPAASAWGDSSERGDISARPRPFTVAVFPDTQNFSMNHPEIYRAMCRWIADNKGAHNIVFASHVGDIVNDDTPEQWANARGAHDLLAEAGVPFGMAIGNHDGGDMYRVHLVGENFLTRFGPEAPYHSADPASETFGEQAWWGGHSASGLSSYQTLPADVTGGVPMLFLHLEVGLREAEIAWAEGVIERHRDRVVIVATHRYLYDWRMLAGRYGPFEHTYLDPMYLGQDAHGDDLHQRLIRSFPNVMMLWCGHVDGDYRQVTENGAGLPVFELLQDYQSFSPRGGNGWLRLYTFDVAAGEVRVNTWSPVAGEGREPGEGRYRSQTDQVDELFIALGSLRGEAGRRAGIDLTVLDPTFKSLLVGAFERPGAMSEFIRSMRTGEGDFAFVFDLMRRYAPDDAARAERMLKEFPWEDVNPGLIRLLDREGGPVLAAFLSEDRDEFRALMTESGNARLIEAFLSDGDRQPSFTLKVPFERYLGNAAEDR